MLPALCLLASLTGGCALTGTGEPLRATFQRVSPAVVVVFTKQRELMPLANAGDIDRYVAVPGLGSGVFIQHEGRPLIFTAAHVVQTADDIFIKFPEWEQPVPAKVISSSPTADVALLEPQGVPAGLAPAVIADSDLVRVGDQVFVVGAPYGLTHTLTVGYVGGRRKSDQVLNGMAAMELFQTDAAINTGNSGGPMFNMDGEVIGIVSHILTRSGGFEGAGFAVTSNLTRQLLLEKGSFWSGVEGYMLRGELAAVFNIPQEAGMLIQRTARNSPAEKLGLRAGKMRMKIQDQELLVGGDIILEVAGIVMNGELENYNKIVERLRLLRDDDLISLRILRAGKVIEIERRRAELK